MSIQRQSDKKSLRPQQDVSDNPAPEAHVLVRKKSTGSMLASKPQRVVKRIHSTPGLNVRQGALTRRYFLYACAFIIIIIIILNEGITMC